MEPVRPPIEEKHARLTQVVKKLRGKRSGQGVSRALRLPQFLRRMEKDPAVLNKLIEHFDSLRHGGNLMLRDVL